MADRREQILVRLLDVCAEVPGAKTALRNITDLTADRRPALIVLDADEAVDDEEFRGSKPPHAPSLVMMTPEVFILVSAAPENVGSELNIMRQRVIRAVLHDAALRGIVGTNGAIRYAGCGTSLAAGRSMGGEMAVSFAFRYVLKPTELEG